MTNDIPSPDDRLHRIERILEALVSTQLEERERRLELSEDIEILYQQQRQTQEQLNALLNQMTALSAQVTAYVSLALTEPIAETHARTEFCQQMLGLQTETRNILRDLVQDPQRRGEQN